MQQSACSDSVDIGSLSLLVMSLDPLATVGMDDTSTTHVLGPDASSSSSNTNQGQGPDQGLGQGPGILGAKLEQYPPNIICRHWPERKLECAGCDVQTGAVDSIIGSDNPWGVEPLPQEWGYYGKVKGYVDIQPQGDLCQASYANRTCDSKP